MRNNNTYIDWQTTPFSKDKEEGSYLIYTNKKFLGSNIVIATIRKPKTGTIIMTMGNLFDFDFFTNDTRILAWASLKNTEPDFELLATKSNQV